MKHIFLVFAFSLVGFISSFGQTAVTRDDLKALEGAKWSGELTYLDYRSGKKTRIRSNVTVSRKPGDHAAWVFAYEYPDEAKANGTSEVKLTEGGKMFGDGTVMERSTAGGNLRIVTTKPGTDNDKKALFRYTYIAGA